jgi:hypothetical protein
MSLRSALFWICVVLCQRLFCIYAVFSSVSEVILRYVSSRVGGGFNGSLIAPGRRGTTSHGRRSIINEVLPTLHGTKLGPNMGGSMPPPPPYPSEPSPHDQWQQSPAQPGKQSHFQGDTREISKYCNEILTLFRT